MTLKDTYNRIAKDWLADHQSDSWWVEGTDIFATYLPPDGKVLDVGCAGGIKSAYLAGKGFSVTGIDFSDAFIDIAKERVPEALFAVMDMRDVRNLAGEFDGVFAQASLLHIPKHEVAQVIAGLASKLKTGGYLYVAVKGKQEGGPDEEVKQENDYGYTYERFFSYYTLPELHDHFVATGLTVVFENIKQPKKTAWVQIIGKK